MKYILYFLLAWFAYKFIFGFVIPVYRTSRKLREKINEATREFEQRTGGNNNMHSGTVNNNPSAQPQSRQPEKEYLDFEEVK